MRAILLEIIAASWLALCIEVWAFFVYDEFSSVKPVPGAWGRRERAHFGRRLFRAVGLILVGRYHAGHTELVRLQAWMEGHQR